MELTGSFEAGVNLSATDQLAVSKAPGATNAPPPPPFD
jgi:hypothetical protein